MTYKLEDFEMFTKVETIKNNIEYLKEPSEEYIKEFGADFVKE